LIFLLIDIPRQEMNRALLRQFTRINFRVRIRVRVRVRFRFRVRVRVMIRVRVRVRVSNVVSSVCKKLEIIGVN